MEPNRREEYATPQYQPLDEMRPYNAPNPQPIQNEAYFDDYYAPHVLNARYANPPHQQPIQNDGPHIAYNYAPYRVYQGYMPPGHQMVNPEYANQQNFYAISSTGASPAHGDLPSTSGYIPTPPHMPRVERVSYTCQICGARGNGIHYGVMTCEACKTFYRCNISKKAELKCKHQKCCDISPQTRKNCKFCRLQKCLDVGMSFDWTKAPTRQQAVEIPERPEPDEMTDMAMEIGREYMSTFVYTGVRVAENPTVCSSGLLYADDRITAWQTFALEVNDEVQRTISFVNKIPRLEGITPYDKATLLKIHMVPMYLIRIMRAFTPNGLTLKDGRVIGFEELRLLFGDALNDIVQAVNRIRGIEVFDSDLGILTAIVFLQPILQECRDVNEFKSNNEKPYAFFNELLKHHLLRRRYGKEILERLHQVLVILDRINESADDSFLDFLRHNRAKFQFPELFTEIFRLEEPASGSEDPSTQQEVPFGLEILQNNVLEVPAVPEVTAPRTPSPRYLTL